MAEEGTIIIDDLITMSYAQSLELSPNILLNLLGLEDNQGIPRDLKTILEKAVSAKNDFNLVQPETRELLAASAIIPDKVAKLSASLGVDKTILVNFVKTGIPSEPRMPGRVITALERPELSLYTKIVSLQEDLKGAAARIGFGITPDSLAFSLAIRKGYFEGTLPIKIQPTATSEELKKILGNLQLYDLLPNLRRLAEERRGNGSGFLPAL